MNAQMGTAIFNGNEPWPSSMDISVEFAAKIAKGEMKVGIIGLGYVGLPTAIGFHDAGFEVWGVDVSSEPLTWSWPEKPNRRPGR